LRLLEGSYLILSSNLAVLSTARNMR
jgi:hypothetical protein